MSLSGKRILITRTRHQASVLSAQLEALGAIPILIPTIEIAPPASFSALDAALTCLRGLGDTSYDWLLFTSANAVEAFHRRAQTVNPHHRLVRLPTKIAAIGPATARTIEAIGLTVDLIPQKYIAESLAEALLPEAPNKTFLLIRAEQARNLLPEILTAAGASVTIAPAYRNQIPNGSIPALDQLFARTPPDAVTFTSASTVTNFFSLLEAANVSLPLDTTLASIGPITSATLRALGRPPQIEAAEPTLEALVQSLFTYLP